MEDPSQQRVIQAELLELIEGRKETIKKNEKKEQIMLMPKRKRNTRGECRVKSEGEKEPKTEPEVKPEGPEVKPKGPEVKPKGPEVKPKGPEVKPKGPEVQEPKLDHTGTNQKPAGSGYNSGVDQKSCKEQENLSLQIEKLATMTTQDKFLNGATINDSDGIIIRLERVIINDPDFYAAWRVDQYQCNLLIINHRMKLLIENGTFQAILETIYEINMCKLIKSHMPVTNRQPDGPEDYLSKMMIGRTCRLVGPIKNWMRGRNRYGRQSDFQVQLRKVTPKQSMDDLMLFAFVAVGAL